MILKTVKFVCGKMEALLGFRIRDFGFPERKQCDNLPQQDLRIPSLDDGCTDVGEIRKLYLIIAVQILQKRRIKSC